MRLRSLNSEEYGSDHRRRDEEDSADDERDVVAAVERREGVLSGCEQARVPRVGEAGEDRETRLRRPS